MPPRDCHARPRHGTWCCMALAEAEPCGAATVHSFAISSMRSAEGIIFPTTPSEQHPVMQPIESPSPLRCCGSSGSENLTAAISGHSRISTPFRATVMGGFVTPALGTQTAMRTSRNEAALGLVLKFARFSNFEDVAPRGEGGPRHCTQWEHSVVFRRPALIRAAVWPRLMFA
jgi:hypothetical protein